jgi:hypothetical protein
LKNILEALNGLSCRGKAAEKFVAEAPVPLLQYGLPQPAAQVKVVGDIMYGHENEGCYLAGHIQMADIAAGEVPAGIA